MSRGERKTTMGFLLLLVSALAAQLAHGAPTKIVVNNHAQIRKPLGPKMVPGMPGPESNLRDMNSPDEGMLPARMRLKDQREDDDDGAPAIDNIVDDRRSSIKLLQGKESIPVGNGPKNLEDSEAYMTTRDKIGEIPNHLAHETQADLIEAESPHGRDDMAANPIAFGPNPYDLTPLPFDADCDSPQSGEVDEQVIIDMNKSPTPKDTLGIPEQTAESRTVPLDKGELQSSEDDVDGEGMATTVLHLRQRTRRMARNAAWNACRCHNCSKRARKRGNVPAASRVTTQ